MSGETNSCTLSISRTRSRCCNLRNQRLVQLLFCSTLGVTLFYIERSCLASWRTWWSDALTLPYPSISELLGLENVEDEYRCGNRIFLADDIVLTSKDSDVILSMIGNLIIEPSLTVLPSPLFGCTPSASELDSCRNSKDHICQLWKASFISHSSSCSGALQGGRFLRSLTLVHCCNSSIGYVKSGISAHLTKSESRAEIIVGVSLRIWHRPCVNPASLRWWLPDLTGRSIVISSCLS